MAIPGWPAYSDDTGTGEDGTELQKTFFDAIHDALEDLLFGVSNPTVSAASIIDEVVTARGSKPNLDARLDASLDAAGLIDNIAANYATDVKVGLVSVAAQNIAGVKTFFSQPQMRQGATTTPNLVVSGLRPTAILGSLSNVSTSETTLHSDTLAANTLDANGKALRLTTWGRFAATANTKTYRVKLGGVTVLEFASTGNDQYFRCVVEIQRITGSTARVSARFEHGPTTDSPIVDNRLQNSLDIAITWTGSVLLTSTGQSSAASNDIIEDVWLLEAIG